MLIDPQIAQNHPKRPRVKSANLRNLRIKTVRCLGSDRHAQPRKLSFQKISVSQRRVPKSSLGRLK
jgi:hypothetical protein